ncbi:MAG: SusE domain-containing protein [Haliscomenobacter sp.]|nr:SusE domain-containing protein [Haliscomenobacter sp.]
MKNWFNKFWVLPVLVLAIAACEKDEDRVYLAVNSAPSLNLSASTLALKEADAAKTALTATVAGADYGFASPAAYKLQFDKKGNSFKTPREVTLTTLNKNFTTAEINTIAIALGITPGVASDLEVRVKSDLINAPTLFSSVAALKVTPYLVIIVYPSLYMPGSYQGWAPDKADKVVSVKSNGSYEGFVNFPDATTEFKFTDAPNWNNGIFGDPGGTSGKLIKGGGDNLKITGAGYYLLKADTEGLTWTATKTHWGVIGSATPGDWGSDTDLTYDVTSKSWKVTMDLKVGEIKFRANDDWGINYGDKEGDSLLDTQNDNNIKIAAAGKYDIELIFSVPGYYSYKLTKK